MPSPSDRVSPRRRRLDRSRGVRARAGLHSAGTAAALDSESPESPIYQNLFLVVKKASDDPCEDLESSVSDNFYEDMGGLYQVPNDSLLEPIYAELEQVTSL